MEFVIIFGLLFAGLYWLGKRSQRSDGDEASAELAGHTPAGREGRGGAPPPPPVDPSVERVRLSTQGRVHVVGTSHYQPALKAAAGGRSVPQGAYEEAIQATALLVPEPTNPHDANAVRVEIGGRTVGYFPREEAVRYQPILRWLSDRGQVGYCPARIMGGGRLHYGVFLHVGPPERLVMWNSPEGIELLDGDRMVVVTGTKDHQDVLGRLDGKGPGGVFPLVAVAFEVGEVERGKYAGLPCLEVLLEGDRVGALTYRMSQAYLPTVQPMVEAGERVGAEGFVQRDGDNLKLHVLMPRV